MTSRKLLLEHCRQDIIIKFRNLRQRSMKVEEYKMEFDKLLMKYDIHEPKEQTIEHCLGGLNTRVADIVQLQLY